MERCLVKITRSLVLVATVGMGSIFSTSALSANYTALDLGDGVINAIGINARGQVIGTIAYPARGDYFGSPFITGPNGMGITIFPATSISGINDAGQVVGWDGGDGPDPFDTRAFFTGPNGVGKTYLEPLGGIGIRATGINNSGQVVGVTDTPPGFNQFQAFITGPNGTDIKDLGTLGGYYSGATAVNASGQVAGASYTNNNFAPHAFITGPNGAGMIDLTPGNNYSTAIAINDAGQVAGNFWAPDGHKHAFVTGADGMGMKDLGTLHGASSSEAYGINASGWVVGSSYIPYDGSGSGGTFAFIAGVDGAGMTDLNSFVKLENNNLTFNEARAINDLGQIVARASGHTYLLSPIPEPESYLLMLAGLGLVGCVARRKKQIPEET